LQFILDKFFAFVVVFCFCFCVLGVLLGFFGYFLVLLGGFVCEVVEIFLSVCFIVFYGWFMMVLLSGYALKMDVCVVVVGLVLWCFLGVVLFCL
jgi:hypothetical protein